jgi:hypothetical protein
LERGGVSYNDAKEKGSGTPFRVYFFLRKKLSKRCTVTKISLVLGN